MFHKIPGAGRPATFFMFNNSITIFSTSPYMLFVPIHVPIATCSPLWYRSTCFWGSPYMFHCYIFTIGKPGTCCWGSPYMFPDLGWAVLLFPLSLWCIFYQSLLTLLMFSIFVFKIIPIISFFTLPIQDLIICIIVKLKHSIDQIIRFSPICIWVSEKSKHSWDRQHHQHIYHHQKHSDHTCP